MSRVLVTGANGFIGRHVVRELLARGYEVHALGRARVAAAAAEKVVFHQGNLLEPSAIDPLIKAARPEFLVHLAWISTPGVFWWAPENTDWAKATIGVFHAFAAQGGRRAVFAGTCAEYDWSFEWLCEDETPLRPRSLYGRAKLEAGVSVLDAARECGVPVAWGRIFFVYGPGEPPGRLISDLISGLIAGRAVDCSAGRQQRDFLYVKDLAAALADILASPFHGAINIASGQCRPVVELMEAVARQLRRPDLIRLGAVPPPSDEPPRLAANVSRLRDRIGFVPKFDLAESIADTVAARRGSQSTT
jgi:nucleoside-diphosphate-sugar epimerase